VFDKLSAIESQYEGLTQRLGTVEVQADQAEYRKAAKELSDLSPLVEKYREYRAVQKDIEGAEEMARGSDEEMRELAEEELKGLHRQRDLILADLRKLLVPKDPNDEKNVILEIRAGTGGDEAALFAADLFRMYSRFAERQGWKLEVMSSSDSGAGGLKEVIASIEGRGVYSRLKYESGVHRVQRVPATEASGRIHTSNSAVRITHIPTNTVVSQQDEKSQVKNRSKAMKVLRARLYEMEMRKQQEAIAKERRGQVGTGERSEKIRTYNFPQSRITDHRINFTTHQLHGVLEGDVTELLDQVADFYNAEKLKEATTVN
jgi:peptide chain release factor 1